MALLIKVTGKVKPDAISNALDKVRSSRKKKNSLSDYYGALPFAYEDGLTYQQKQRDEWE